MTEDPDPAREAGHESFASWMRLEGGAETTQAPDDPEQTVMVAPIGDAWSWYVTEGPDMEFVGRCTHDHDSKAEAWACWRAHLEERRACAESGTENRLRDRTERWRRSSRSATTRHATSAPAPEATGRS